MPIRLAGEPRIRRGREEVNGVFCDDGSSHPAPTGAAGDPQRGGGRPAANLDLLPARLRFRKFRGTVQDLFVEDLAPGSRYFCQGQDAIPVWFRAVLRFGDTATRAYRQHERSLSDSATYRPEGELKQRPQRGPITMLGEAIPASGEVSQDDLPRLRDQVKHGVHQEFERASSRLVPDLTFGTEDFSSVDIEDRYGAHGASQRAACAHHEQRDA